MKIGRINNIPNYAADDDYKYFVVRNVEDEMWFWGAFNDEDKANQAAIEINGSVVTMR